MNRPRRANTTVYYNEDAYDWSYGVSCSSQASLADDEEENPPEGLVQPEESESEIEEEEDPPPVEIKESKSPWKAEATPLNTLPYSGNQEIIINILNSPHRRI